MLRLVRILERILKNLGDHHLDFSKVHLFVPMRKLTQSKIKWKINIITFNCSKDACKRIRTGDPGKNWSHLQENNIKISSNNVQNTDILRKHIVILFLEKSYIYYGSPVIWGCRIHRQHLCRGVRLPMSVLDMTLNDLMLRLQFWSFGEFRVSIHCHCSKVNSDPEW